MHGMLFIGSGATLAPGKLFVVLGSVSLAIATAAAAIGSHVLDAGLGERALASFETAVRLHFYHGLGLLTLPSLAGRFGSAGWLAAAGWLFVAGTVLFSGAIYATVGGLAPLGRLPPVGGTCLILGWLAVATAALRSR